MHSNPASATPSLRRSMVLCAVMVGLLLFCVQSAHAAATLDVVGGTDVRTVELQPCTRPGAQSVAPAGIAAPATCAEPNGQHQLSLVGQLSLLVHVKENEGVAPVVRFIADGSTPISLPGGASWIDFEEKPVTPGEANRAPSTPPAEELRLLVTRFALAPGQSPDAIDGSLVLSVGGTAVSVPLAGKVRDFKDISVIPKDLTMDSDSDAATVTLVGPDLVQFLRSRGFDQANAVLRSDAGDTTEAEIELPTADEVAASAHPNRAKATVKLTNAEPSPGKYSGKLALSDLSAEAPAIDVTLNSRRGILWLVAATFLGVFFVGLATRLVTLAMRRSLLLDVLGQSMAAYRNVRDVKKFGTTRAWSLDNLLGGTAAPKELEEGRLQGVEALEYSIETARSSKDLDEDAQRVLDMVARIQRWLRVEPAVRRFFRSCRRAGSCERAWQDLVARIANMASWPSSAGNSGARGGKSQSSGRTRGSVVLAGQVAQLHGCGLGQSGGGCGPCQGLAGHRWASRRGLGFGEIHARGAGSDLRQPPGVLRPKAEVAPYRDRPPARARRSFGGGNHARRMGCQPQYVHRLGDAGRAELWATHPAGGDVGEGAFQSRLGNGEESVRLETRSRLDGGCVATGKHRLCDEELRGYLGHRPGSGYRVPRRSAGHRGGELGGVADLPVDSAPSRRNNRESGHSYLKRASVIRQ